MQTTHFTKNKSVHHEITPIVPKNKSTHSKTAPFAIKNKSAHLKTASLVLKDKSTRPKTASTVPKNRSKHPKTALVSKNRSKHPKTALVPKNRSKHPKTALVSKNRSTHPKTASLILKDGTILKGKSFGTDVPAAGEVVFNTGMAGYPESFTDPSYEGQILVLTYPLIGNYGIPSNAKDKYGLPKHFESNKIHIRGLIVSEYSENFSHWNAKKSLGDWLKENNIPAISGIDTRALTQKLRTHGTMLGRIETDIQTQPLKHPRSNNTLSKQLRPGITTPVTDARALSARASLAEYMKPGLNYSPQNQNQTQNNPQTTNPFSSPNSFPNPNKENLVAQVSIKKPILYESGKTNSKRIILIDCGMKFNILRNLLQRNLTVLRIPWDYDFLKKNSTFKNNKFDGILISNGPGDPAILTPLHKNIRKVFKLNKERKLKNRKNKTLSKTNKQSTKPIPIFGICLCNQILAIAAGAKTYKMKFGHRAQNQPVIDVSSTSSSISTTKILSSNQAKPVIDTTTSSSTSSSPITPFKSSSTTQNQNHCYITSQNHGFAVNEKTLPKDWKIWLRNLNDNTNEGIMHKTLPYFSCQFHPEATPGPTDTNTFFDKFIALL